MRLVILTIIMSFFVVVLADAVLVGRNIISNSGFENRPGGKDEDPRGWSSWNSDLNGLATNEFRSGSQSAYLVCPKTNDSDGVFFDYTKVKRGKEYTFSAYVKNSLKDPMKGEVFGQISIEWLKKGKDKDGKEITIEISRDWGPKFGPELPFIKWVPFAMSATAPADADICRFVVQFFNKGEGSGKFFVDDVAAEELDRYLKEKRRIIPIIKSKETTSAGKEVADNGLLPNAGFEEPKGASGSDPADWVAWNTDYNGITSDKAKSGKQSVYISSASEPQSHTGIFYQYNGVKSGKEYIFSCYVMNSAKDPITKGAYGQLSIEWRQGDNELIRTWGPAFGAELSTREWTPESMTALPPEGADNCRFVIQLFNKEGKGTFFVDNAAAEEKK